MQQPSAQGIAALFRGNPQPLQQRIQMDQQAKPGLPPDLQKLLALNIVTNEKDAVAKQQAMDQLAQMRGPQGPQGQPPTVMQTVQDQARQKMEMQAQQAQQQMQQQQMQQFEPQAQPQGIDQLPVDFQMAGGGIVAFKEGDKVPRVQDEYETPYDRMNRENKEDADRPERKKDEEGLLKALALLAAPLAAAGDVVAAPFRGLYGLTQHGETSMTPLMDARARFLASSENSPSAEAFVREVSQARQAPTEAPISRPTSQMTPQQMEAAMRIPTGIQQGLPDLVKPAPRPVRPSVAGPVLSAAPVMPAAQIAATQAALPPQESEADLIQKAVMRRNPEEERIAAQERRKAEVGAPDTSQYDRLVDELEKRKAQFEGPKDQWGQLMEYFGQVAATPRGLSSFEAGAKGAAGVKQLQEARQLEQFNLSKQAVDVSQKKLDAVRSFAEKQYDVGEAKFNDVFGKQFEAAKLISKSEEDARRLAQENTLKRLELEQRATEASERNKTQLAASNIGQAKTYAEEARNKQYQDLMATSRKLALAGDQAGSKEALARANDIAAIAGRGAAASMAAGPKAMTRDQAEDNVRKDLEDFRVGPKLMNDATAALKASGIANPTTLQIKEYLVQQNMKGVDLSIPAQTGKVPSPPPGFKLN